MLQSGYLLDMAISVLIPQLDHDHRPTKRLQAPLSKFEEGTTWITSWVAPESASRTPRENCMSPPRTARGDMRTSIDRPVSGGLTAFSTRRGDGESTSIAFRRGGGVDSDPGEWVVVAMLLPSLGHFLDLLEGPAEPLPIRAPEPFTTSNISMLICPFLWAARC